MPGITTTRWSRLLAGEANAGECWSYFYERYREVVAGFFRRAGLPAGEDVEDLVHSFFQIALERGFLQQADPARGRFRAYLKTAAVRFLHSARRRSSAQRRGGGVRTLSLDEAPDLPLDRAPGPDRQFDLDWARAVLRAAQVRLMSYLERHGAPDDPELFRHRTEERTPWPALAEKLQTPAGTLRKRYDRIRAQMARFIAEEVRQTVGSEDEVEQELAALRGLFDELR